MKRPPPNSRSAPSAERANTTTAAGVSFGARTARASINRKRGDMAETANFPYETRLNILHGPLEVIDEKAISDACEYDWFNQTLCKVNDSVVRLGVVKGEYHWHKHDNDDEFFYVVDGRLLIDLENRTVEL